MKVAPSIIAAQFSAFQTEIESVQRAGADLLHLDIMDGVFVPNITFGPMVVQAIREVTRLELDAHLMITQPERYLKVFIDAGLDWLSFHSEATRDPLECLSAIQQSGVKAGLAINPGTPLSSVVEHLERLDYLLIMTVNPGFYGQKFMAEILPKIRAAKDHIVRHNLPCQVQVDGGINAENALDVCRAGADIIVAGAGIFKAENYKTAIEVLRCSKV